MKYTTAINKAHTIKQRRWEARHWLAVKTGADPGGIRPNRSLDTREISARPNNSQQAPKSWHQWKNFHARKTTRKSHIIVEAQPLCSQAIFTHFPIALRKQKNRIETRQLLGVVFAFDCKGCEKFFKGSIDSEYRWQPAWIRRPEMSTLPP